MRSRRKIVLGQTVVAVMLFCLCCSGAGDDSGPGEVATADTTEDAVHLVDAGPYDLPEEAFAFDFGPGQDGTNLPACDPGEGCFLDKCSENSDCLSGWCVEHLGEGVCTMTCVEDCAAGWKCTEVPWSYPDLLFVCLSDFANLCKPCNTSDDCVSSGGEENACVVFEGGGGFCGGNCDITGEGDLGCPAGYECAAATSVEGLELAQCTLTAGECPCTGKSIEDHRTTWCHVTNDWGTCTGSRLCEEGGLSACDAPEPAGEECNGVDDDCDGEMDESTCNDDNLCTDDSCVSGECQFVPNLADCDDDNQCTIDDKCGDGECAGVPGGCDCMTDADCAAFEDGDLCTGTLYCDLENFPYECKTVPDSPVVCPGPEGPDAPCLTPVCDGGSGECSLAAANGGAPCNDEDACTSGEACLEGVCSGGDAVNCNDGNGCTDDGCEPDAGCVYTPNDLPCQDGDVCTTADTCGGGECAGGPPLECDDQNVCTDDSCAPDSGCVFTPNTLPCDDGSACTIGEQCSGGSCLGGEQIICEDNNPCTDDSCVDETGCLFEANAALCDDLNPCTVGDQCAAGECGAGTPLNCDDDNVCTDDFCLAVDGDPDCQHSFNSDPCGGGFLCVDGVCSCIPSCAGKECGDDGCGGDCYLGGLLCEEQAGVCQGAEKTEDLCAGGLLDACATANYFWNNNAYEEGAETSCDALDNDCDGQVDEDLGTTTCGLGVCEHTVEDCVGGIPQVCNAGEGSGVEKCDGLDNDCDGLVDETLGTSSCGVGICFHVVENCQGGEWKECDPFAGAMEEILDGIDNDCDGQADEGFPVAGAILITEMMVNPDCAGDDFAEWLELYNPSGDTWDLSGWFLKDADNDKITISPDSPLEIAPGGYVVLGVNADLATNGGVALDAAYNVNKFQMANSSTGDEVMLVGPGGVVVDEVVWGTGLGFPDFNGHAGKSISLAPAAYDHEANDDGANWAPAGTPMDGGCGDFGTPGGANGI